jgi:RNA polymerase-binding transcription factor DksA
LLKARRDWSPRGHQARDITPDPLDTAKEVEAEQLWLAVLDRRDKITGQIQEAAARLKEGRYGWCVE